MNPSDDDGRDVSLWLGHARALYDALIVLPPDDVARRSAVWSTIVELQGWINAVLSPDTIPPDTTSSSSSQAPSAERRNVERYKTDWVARYRLAARDPWRPGRVLDASATGAAVELLDTASGDDFTGRLHLEIVSIDSETIGCASRVWIRRHVRLANGSVLVGIEFAHRGSEEANLLRLMWSLRAAP
jgi:hypothetical protein